MRRIGLLVALFQGGGNIPLLLPIVTRLTKRGHRVRCLVGPGVRASRLAVSEDLHRSLHAIGAHVVSLGEPDPHPLDGPPTARGIAPGWVPRPFAAVAAEARVSRWIPWWAQVVDVELRREPAEAVVADFVLVGALVAAEQVGVPSVALGHTVYPHPTRNRPPYGPGWLPRAGVTGRLRDALGFLLTHRIHSRHALPFLNRGRQTLGLSPLGRYFEQYDRASRVVVLTSPAFDPPEGFPSNVRLVGTPLGDSTPCPASDAWLADDGRPLVLVSLSTLDQGQTALMQRILAALAGLPVRALVTLGPSLAAGRFTPPANVVLERFVPHASVLPHAAAMVSQCGLGTVMKSLAHGVPLVCIPLVGDQAENAARVQALGAGVRLPSDAGPSRIRAAIARVLADRALRVNAERIGRAIAGEDPVQAAVAEIESVLHSA